MSATQKFFRKVFGATGDRTAVPDTTPTDGSISYEQGYGFDYQRAPGDPLVKNIERDKLNQVLFDLTLGLRQYQTHGFPEYIQPADNGGVAFSYDKNAFVLWTDGQVYQSIAAGNTSDPTDTTKWQLAILGTGVGAVTFFPSSAPPTGYVKANGALLSRVAYPVLWAYAQASGNLSVSDAAWNSGQFSPGDGATTFRIPDVRGYQLRAHDDGRGVDSGRVLGTAQADAIGVHNHALTDPGHVHALGDPGHAHGVTDPTHFHPLPDPGHSHGIAQNPHVHGVTDPTHAHGITDPGHSHTTGIPMSNESGNTTPWGSGGGTAEGTFVFTENSAVTGVTVNAAGTGVSIQGGLADVSVNVAGTGISIGANATGIGVNAAGTGMTLGAAATGMSVQNTGGAETRSKNIALLGCLKYM